LQKSTAQKKARLSFRSAGSSLKLLSIVTA
jgi:hypothetical protein